MAPPLEDNVFFSILIKVTDFILGLNSSLEKSQGERERVCRDKHCPLVTFCPRITVSPPLWPPQGSRLSIQYVDGLRMAKSRVALSRVTYREADPSDQDGVPWGAGRTRMIPSCDASGLCPLAPGTHVVFVSSPI